MHHHILRDIPVQQLYDRIAFKRSEVRSWDQMYVITLYNVFVPYLSHKQNAKTNGHFSSLVSQIATSPVFYN